VGGSWELKIGLYIGVLLGFRIYEQENCTDYVAYFLLFDICLTIYKD